MKNPFISLDLTSSPVIERTKLQKAWEHFIDGKYHKPEIRPLMLESWQRCLTQGVHPIQSKAPIILPNSSIEEYLANNSLYPLLEPLFKKLKEVAIDTGHLVVFCNSNGDIVYLDGNASLRTKAEQMNFIPGASWSEEHVGTNAIGTALFTGTPLQVFAEEHFCQEVQKWACSAAPIRDPATQKILGVIDLTGLWSAMHPHSLSAVVSTAHAIEERLHHQLKVEQIRLAEYYLDNMTRKPHIPIAVLDRGCSVIKASSILHEHGWIDSGKRLIDCPGDLFSFPSKRFWEVERMNGKWRFELDPYFFENQLIGALVQVAPPSQVNRKNSAMQEKANNNASTKHSFSTMIGNSPRFQSVINEASLASRTDLPVLIEGESGTGKELMAQSIHSASKRAAGPFVAVNCGAIPKDLAASEFFGYEEGAFTGGMKGGRAGKFQQADGGTIFLDEIGEMPLDLQTILLRVLEEGEVVRLGGRKPIRLNVRVIAATNKDLLGAIEKGKFRQDLYYRLNILSLQIPPLRERLEDIDQLAEHHIHKACIDIGRAPLLVNKEAMDRLKSYRWPGNVRELRNFAYRMATKIMGDMVTLKDLPHEMLESGKDGEWGQPSQTVPSSIMPLGMNRVDEHSSLKDQELQMILSVLNELNGNVTETAKRLGIHRSTIYRKLGKGPSKK